MSKLALASLSVLLALGCAHGARRGDVAARGGGGWGGPPPSAAPSGPAVTDFRVIEKGTQSLLTKDTQVFFRDAVTFERWYETHTHDRKAPAVNFNKEMVVAVVLPRNTGGFTVNLDQVVATPEGLRVVYTETRPTTDMAVIQALTQPYFIAVVPKQPGNVVFEKHIKSS